VVEPPPEQPAEAAPVANTIYPGFDIARAEAIIHDPDGSYLRTVELADVLTGSLEEVPPGGMVTVALSANDGVQLATFSDVQAGDALVVGRRPRDEDISMLPIELPTMAPGATKSRQVYGGCDSTDVKADDAATLRLYDRCVEDTVPLCGEHLAAGGGRLR
jgi:hypothetical protein